MHYEKKEIIWSLYTYHCLIEVVAKTGLTVIGTMRNILFTKFGKKLK